MNAHDRNRMMFLVDLFKETLSAKEKDEEELRSIMLMTSLEHDREGICAYNMEEFQLNCMYWAYIADREGLIKVRDTILECLGYQPIPIPAKKLDREGKEDV